jgi:hypothetical protein
VTADEGAVVWCVCAGEASSFDAALLAAALYVAQSHYGQLLCCVMKGSQCCCMRGCDHSRSGVYTHVCLCVCSVATLPVCTTSTAARGWGAVMCCYMP